MAATASAFWHPFADMATVAGRPFVVARGEGVHVWDDQGRRYLDGSASLWHVNVGHGRQEIVDAVARQMAELDTYQTFGDLANAPALELCDRLASLTEMPDARVFLGLGGGDAVETAAKLARHYWHARGLPGRAHLISRSFGYHGTHGFGTSLSGMEALRSGFDPLIGAVSHVPYDDVDALEQEILRLGPDRVAAFFCEPVIGAGGVRPAPEGYMEGVAAVCERHDVLFIVDGVICAFGRVGTWFGYERWDVEPDMVTLAKGITSGYLPLGAVLVSGKVAEPFYAEAGGPMFRHGQTYSGHPTCCAAALANLDILEREQLIPRGRELEGDLWNAVAPLADHPACGDVRGGVGLAAAVDITTELQRTAGVGAFYGAVREAGVLLRAQASGLAISPPLTVTREQLGEIAEAVRAGLDSLV